MRKFKSDAALGYKHGSQQGYDKGYNDGFAKGYEAGMQGGPYAFTGTSIIIPTMNNLQYLEQCIESIIAHTNRPYELIIVDNASTDGTAQYLQSHSAELKFKLNNTNLGFAGAVNQGLHMATGATLLILNNDAIVTTHWLDNLLRCVHSDPSIGIVGPVTNYISGEQLHEVTYGSMTEMHQFAEQFNQSNAQLWTETQRLTGFCIVMKRSVFERLGYFDEGFEIGNCEDDDYGLRARLLGLRLIIARDTFIHHYGSVSMKTLQTRFEQVYEKNLAYFSAKWEEPQTVLHFTTHHPAARTVDFYPSHVVVRGVNAIAYWLEKGTKYEIMNGKDIDAVRVSTLDFQCWPIGGSISREEYKRRLAAVCEAQLAGHLIDGVIVEMKGKNYQFSDNRLHYIVSDHTHDVWFSQRPNVRHEINESYSYEVGNPIIAPIIIQADNI